MSNDQTFELVFLQRLGGGMEILERGIAAKDGLARLQRADREEDFGPGGIVFLRPEGATSPARGGPDPNLWSVIGNTLHLGPTGSLWIAFPGDVRTAQQLAEAHNHAVAAAYADARADEPAIARERTRADEAILEAQAEAAALRHLIHQQALIVPADIGDAGAAFLAELMAARAVVEVARRVLSKRLDVSALWSVLRDYDAVKVGQKP